MKTILLYRTIFLLLLAPAIVFSASNTNPTSKHTKEKTIKKSFNVNPDATLKVNNSYGNLNIMTWDQNRIDIEVTITTDGKDLDKVTQKLDEITVDFEATSSLVSATTIFNKNKSNSWWKWNGGSNVNMTVNYVIKMPMSNSVNLSNDYGNINLDKLEGDAKISCDYGKITTKELMAHSNISFDYSKGCYFEYINAGNISADYSGFTIAKAKNLNISADYTDSEIELVEDVNYNCDYGSMKVDKVNNLKGNGDYLSVVVGDVYQNLQIDADYGSIKIGKMTANSKDLKISSDYTGITIGYDAAYHFNFDMDLEYASLRGDDNFQFTYQEKDGSDKVYKGYYGSNNTSNMIQIESDYGNITFDKK